MYNISKSGVLESHSFNIALLDNFISQYTEQSLFALYGEILPFKGGEHGESTLPLSPYLEGQQEVSMLIPKSDILSV